MKMLIQPRNTGKTTTLVCLSARDQLYIVVPTNKRRRSLWHISKVLDVKIPYPITWEEYIGGHFHPPGIRGFLFDDLDDMIRMSANGVPVIGFSATLDTTTAEEK